MSVERRIVVARLPRELIVVHLSSHCPLATALVRRVLLGEPGRCVRLNDATRDVLADIDLAAPP